MQESMNYIFIHMHILCCAATFTDDTQAFHGTSCLFWVFRTGLTGSGQGCQLRERGGGGGSAVTSQICLCRYHSEPQPPTVASAAFKQKAKMH